MTADIEHAGGFGWSTRRLGDQIVVTGVGELDLATAPTLREVLGELIDAGHHRIVLDLSRVTFCDSVGLGVMVGAFGRIEDSGTNGHLKVVCGRPVRRVLELTGLTRVLSVHNDLAAADSDRPTSGRPEIADGRPVSRRRGGGAAPAVASEAREITDERYAVAGRRRRKRRSSGVCDR